MDKCDFETSTCDWGSNQTAWQWARKTGAGLEADESLGPHQDHLGDKNGHFLLVKASDGAAEGDYAQLQSGTLRHEVRTETGFI